MIKCIVLTHFGLDGLSAEWESAVVCIGTFDGIHIGHQAVISEAVTQARASGWPSVVVTFDRHPLAFLSPAHCPPAIGTLNQKLSRIAKLGVSACVVLAFDESLATLDASEFLNKILVGKLNSKSLVVGHDFACGHNRIGTPEWLQQHINTVVVPACEKYDLRVSSRAIRDLISAGNVATAAELLGHSFALEGIIVSGQKIGRTIGFPTANLARSFDQIVPADGVYAGSASIGVGTYACAIGIGNRPTVQGTHRTIEAHLLDFAGADFYGNDMTLDFIQRLRDEVRYENMDALKSQMALDVEATRRIVANVPPKSQAAVRVS